MKGTHGHFMDEMAVESQIQEDKQAPPGAGDKDPISGMILEGRHREAVAMCARQHGAALGRLCMAMLGSQGEAEETVQDVLLAAYHAMDTFRGEGSAKAWLYGIARRQCAKRLEKRIRRERRLHLVKNAAQAGDELPEGALIRKKNASILRKALEKLKPSEREVVLLRYESELSYRDIGIACGIDEAAARKRASRALAHLQTILGPSLAELHPSKLESSKLESSNPGWKR